MCQGGLVRCTAAVAAERGLGARQGGEGKCLRRAGAAASDGRLLVGLRDGEYAQGRVCPFTGAACARMLCDAGGTACVYVGGSRTWDVTRLGDRRDMFLHPGSMRSYVSDCLCVRLRMRDLYFYFLL